QIDAALKDLAEVLARNPRNAPGASHPGDRVASTRCLRRCQRRMPSTQKSDKELTWTACLMSVNGVAGKLRESYEQLRIAVNRQPNEKTGSSRLGASEPRRDGGPGGHDRGRAKPFSKGTRY